MRAPSVQQEHTATAQRPASPVQLGRSVLLRVLPSAVPAGTPSLRLPAQRHARIVRTTSTRRPRPLPHVKVSVGCSKSPHNQQQPPPCMCGRTMSVDPRSTSLCLLLVLPHNTTTPANPTPALPTAVTLCVCLCIHTQRVLPGIQTPQPATRVTPAMAMIRRAVYLQQRTTHALVSCCCCQGSRACSCLSARMHCSLCPPPFLNTARLLPDPL